MIVLAFASASEVSMEDQNGTPSLGGLSWRFIVEFDFSIPSFADEGVPEEQGSKLIELGGDGF